MRIVALLALGLLSTNTFARERAFRVVGGTAIESGFALAWGLKGQNLDFEALDKQGDTRKFFEDNQDKLVNYLVDLENESILDTVMEPALVGRAGDSWVLHNHDTVGLVEMPIEGNDSDEYGMAVMASFKWYNELTKVVVVKKGFPQSVVVLENKTIQNNIENALLNKLSAAKRKQYIDYQGAVTWSFRTVTDKEFRRFLMVDAEAIHPKLEDPSLRLSGKLQLVRKNDVISVKVFEADLKEVK